MGEEPELKLWVAVLALAVSDAKLPKIKGKFREESKDALRWFKSSRESAGSFRWVCDVVGMHPDFVLKRAGIQGLVS